MFLNPYQSLIKRLLLSSAIVIVIMNMLMTGSRGPVYNAIITVTVVSLALVVLDPKRLQRNLTTILLIGAVSAVGTFKSPALKDFIYRAQNSDTMEGRGLTVGALAMVFIDVFRYDDLLGEGAGSYHQSSWGYMRMAGIPLNPKQRIEQEPDRVLAELGPVGFVFWYGMRASFIVLYIQLTRKTRNMSLKMLALVFLLMHVQSIYTTMVFHHTFGLY